MNKVFGSVQLGNNYFGVGTMDRLVVVLVLDKMDRLVALDKGYKTDSDMAMAFHQNQSLKIRYYFHKVGDFQSLNWKNIIYVRKN